MKKKTIFSIIFCMIVSVCVLFTGCGGTDLSGINSQIAELKQQIISLNETIANLKNEIKDAKGDITSLQSQLAIASANYDKLSKQVYGTEPSYKKLNDKSTYTNNGIKLFDITPTSLTIGVSAVLLYDFNSNINNLSNITEFGFNAILYTENTNKTYESVKVDNNGIRFTANDFDVNSENGIIYLFVDSSIFAIYELNFVSTSN